MFDTNIIENSFDELLTVFSARAASAFSSCLFSIQHGSSKTVDLFEKLIYNKGNQQEIYTKNERAIIDKILQYYICSEFHVFEKHQRVLCRILAIDLSFSRSLIHDAVAAMKICNKALEGYNLYILVGEEAIHVGCDILGDAGRTGCTISYPIERNINWDALLYNFLEIIDDKGFIQYYHSTIDAISSVHNCYNRGEKLDSPSFVSSDDSDDVWYDISDDNLYMNSQNNEQESYNKLQDFMREVEDVKNELAYITTNRVNSLEMLFDAEEQMKKAEQAQQTTESLEMQNEDHYDKYKSLLSNPEELIKTLKNRNK